MANNYYSSDNPYQGQASFSAPPVQQPYNPPPYSGPPRGSEAGSAYHVAPAPSHHYQPRDESPRYRGTPPPPNMQVAPYRGYDDGDEYPPPHHHSHHSRDPYSEPNSHYHPGHHHHDDYYDEPPRGGHRGSVDDREVERSRGSVSGGHHDNKKKVGAALAGAAIGGLAGHEVGHGGVATIIGALAGGFAGEKLEKRHEKHKEEAEEKRELEHARGPPRHPVGPYAPGGAFSDVGSDGRSKHVSRRHDRSPSYSDESGSEYDGGRRQSRRY